MTQALDSKVEYHCPLSQYFKLTVTNPKFGFQKKQA